MPYPPKQKMLPILPVHQFKNKAIGHTHANAVKAIPWGRGNPFVATGVKPSDFNLICSATDEKAIATLLKSLL